MRLDRLILDNFLTYKNIDYQFENKPLLIQGLNLTDDGQTTNGTGKSGLQTGIEVCITSSNSRGVRDNELVTYGEKQARVQLYASCDVRKEIIHIDWDIKVVGSNVLRLKTKKYDSSEWKDVSFSNVDNGKKAIIDWFAISKEDLFNYYLVNNTRFKSFFKSSNAEKVALINRFSDASIVSDVDDIDLTSLELQIRDNKAIVSETSGKIDLIKEQIQTEKDRDLKVELAKEKETILEDISDLKIEIESVSETILNKTNLIKTMKDGFEAEQLLKKSKLKADQTSLKNNLQATQDSLDQSKKLFEQAKGIVDNFEGEDWDTKREVFESKISGLNETRRSELAKQNKFQTQLQQVKMLINNAEVALNGSIVCPNCKHEFILDGDIEDWKTKLKQGSSIKEKIQKGYETCEEALNSIKKTIEEVSDNVSKINGKETLELKEKSGLQKNLNKASKDVLEVEGLLQRYKGEQTKLNYQEEDLINAKGLLEGKIENSLASIKNLKQGIAGYQEKIKDLQQKMNDLKVGSNKKILVELKEKLIVFEESLINFKKKEIELDDAIYGLRQWILNFKQFKMHLANQSLEVIQYHCNRYLDEMGSDLIVKIEGFKIKADGKAKEEITATIIRGRERTFSSFSGGERGRLLFASILANRHMINETHPYGGFDFLAVDEVFEGVDASGLESLIDSAKLLSIPVMIITHVSLESENENVLTIVKENDISKIL